MDIQKFKNDISIHVRYIAENTGFSYLNCWEGEWKDGSGNIHHLNDMNTRYLKNCLNELNKSLEYWKMDSGSNLRHRLPELIKGIDLLTAEEQTEIVFCLRNEFLNLVESKISEIEFELENR